MERKSCQNVADTKHTLLAFTLEQAAHLSRLDVGVLRYWDNTSFFHPSLRRAPGHPYGRVYSFRDVVSLRTLAQLRKEHKVPLQVLRRVRDWLTDHYESPWSELRFYVAGREVFFRDEDIEVFRHGRWPEQTVHPIELKEVAATAQADADRMRDRTPAEFGKVERHRYIIPQ
jgi:DNA-binding transcriptional MerR regulator